MPRGIYERKNRPWNYGLCKENNETIRLAGIKHGNTIRGKSHGHKTNNGNTAWNKGKTWSKEMKEKLRKAKLRNPVRYWKGKKRLHMSGEKHPNWIKDRTKLKTDRIKAYDYKYKLWSREIKNRDKWKCKISNNDCSGAIEAHHILSWSSFPELRYEINNGITLCKHHHPRKRSDENRLADYFKQLISIINI